jgi:hypothetical protein
MEGWKTLCVESTSWCARHIDALFAAIDASLVDGNTGDWCGVKSKASAAGYAICRFYDTASGRWFIYAYDTTSFGQAYFFINPFAKRNIVIEVPHEGFDIGTGREGSQIFKGLAARALIINKEHRCSDPDTSGCFLGYVADVCDNRYRESDVAHHLGNTFHLLHMRYTDMDPVTKFAQLHGFGTSNGYNVEIADGTTRDTASNSVSIVFANHLRSQIPAGDAALALACQEFPDGMPPSGRCATKNLQGRYTNNPTSGGCLSDASSYSGRFLHIEQAQTLRDENDNDGWYWADVMEALRLTWGDCNMNNGATDCTLGSAQTQYLTWSCSSVNTMNAK